MGKNTTTRLLSDGAASSWMDCDETTNVQRGTTLGRFTVLEAVGSGGMGNVYAAWDPALRRRVAIKVLHAMGRDTGQGMKDRARALLAAEAQAAARLTHPNVVAIYDVGTFGERLFIAMELVEGQTLRAWIAQPRPWREVLEVYRQAGRGLAAAHRAGLVHRDFKPGNVMLASDGQVKILDFGLAKAISVGSRAVEDEEPTGASTPSKAGGTGTMAAYATAVRATTGTGRVLGTPHFMSPEQLRGDPVDHRSDQFSFCVSLYQGLFACLPFATEGKAEAPLRPLDGPVRPPPESSGVPTRFHAALERGLSGDPDARYATMDDLLDDLKDEPSSSTRWTVLALLAAIVAITAYFLPRPQAVPCEAAGAHLDAVWNDNRKRSLEQVFASQGAIETWPRVASMIDSRVLELRSMYTESCEATHVRMEQSSELLDRRVACLDDRRRAMDSLLRVIEQAQPKVVAEASLSVGALDSLAACADLQALSDLAPEPPTESSSMQIAATRDHLAEAHALELAGRYQDALPVARTALTNAERANYRPLLGEAQLQHARIIGRLGDSEAMRASLFDAVSTALASQHRTLLAQAFSQLVVVGFLRGEVVEAQAYGDMAEATISTLSGRDDLEAQLIFFLGMISLREGRLDEAKSQYERYLDLPVPLSPHQKITALSNYATALGQLGELEAARQALLRAESMIDQLAPGHQMRFGILGALAVNSGVSGDWQQAEEYALRCVAGVEASLGAQHPYLGSQLVTLGEIYLETQRLDRAVSVLQRATEIHQNMPGYEQRPALRRWLLGRALWEQGQDREAALRWIREAAAMVDAGEQETVEAASEWLREQGRL